MTRTLRAISRADPDRHERRSKGKQPQWDLNSLVTADAVLLFAIDLAYHPDAEERVFRFRGPRELESEYELPAQLEQSTDLFRVDADGIHEVSHESTERGIVLRDKIDRVGVCVAIRQPKLRGKLGDQPRFRAREIVAGPC